ncbi:septum site-determining protein Ssd [Aeromicrobium sp. CF4.19]|uniref:septum site-determining protein Ssd n=1 Tax=Aeromicrobium sp. CF4.19 TaxID=3373082 RepID=UPI003EE7C627
MDAVPLVATADAQILEDALRWCAALGTTPHTAADVIGARRSWRSAALVVVGADLAPELAAAGLARRDHVLVVDDGRPGERVWAAAVALGAVEVVSSADETVALEALARSVDGRGEGCLVTVISAVGGAGGSVFTAALGARAVRRGLDAAVLDLDPLGGGLDLVLGAEEADGARWQGLAGADGTLSAGSLAQVLPRHDGLAALTWSRDEPVTEPTALTAVLGAATRGFDVVVADAPRHGGSATAEVVGRSVCSVVLVPEETRALGAARALLETLGGLTTSIAVLCVARSGGPGPALVERTLARPVLGRLRPDRRLRASVEQGFGPRTSRSLARSTDAVLDLLGLAAP